MEKIISNCKVLIVGTGSIGTRHKNNFSKLINNVSYYSYREDQRIANYNSEEISPKLENLIKEANAVVIANRTDLHLKVALLSAKLGKDILIEKPISFNLIGIEELKRTCKKNKLILESGCMLRFHPNLRWLKAFLHKNELGSLQYIRSSVGQFLPDWRPDRDYLQGYAAKKKWGGGVVLDLIHEIDLLLWLFGDIDEVSLKDMLYKDREAMEDDLLDFGFHNTGQTNEYQDIIDQQQAWRNL